PAYAVRSTPQASIVQATQAVAEGRAEALVSGGSTGPALAAGLFYLRRDQGIYRPALALPLLRPGHLPVLLLDVGANVECRPEHLVQFAHMGSAFASAVLGIDSPRVALLSNGEEPAKGTPDLKEVHERLSGDGGAGLRFVGNVEGNHVFGNEVDVVVADGFIGNIGLKLIEGVSAETMRLMRNAAHRSLRAKVGGFLLGPSIDGLRREIDPEVTGGAYMLGLRQTGIVCHGRFTRRGFGRAIEVAAHAVEQDVVSRTRAALAEAGALRRSRAEVIQTGETPGGRLAARLGSGPQLGLSGREGTVDKL
ncbi:MAG: phosphate acyltransferase, partial [Solirubrobacteraceae bacterium]